MRSAFSTLRGRIAISVVSLAALTAIVGLAVFSAFSSTQAGGTNAFTAGTVVLGTNGTGSVLFDLPNMKPDDFAMKCVEVTYNGTLAAGVAMTGTESGALAPDLGALIIRGTFSGATPEDNACDGFVADASNNILYNGALDLMPATIADPGGPTVWTAGSKHVYQIRMNLMGGAPNTAQGASASTAFTWAASNN